MTFGPTSALSCAGILAFDVLVRSRHARIGPSSGSASPLLSMLVRKAELCSCAAKPACQPCSPFSVQSVTAGNHWQVALALLASMPDWKVPCIVLLVSNTVTHYEARSCASRLPLTLLFSTPRSVPVANQSIGRHSSEPDWGLSVRWGYTKMQKIAKAPSTFCLAIFSFSLLETGTQARVDMTSD